MRVGIIGAGAIGATLARRLGLCGHEIKLANSRGPQSILDLALELGVVASSAAQAVTDSDVIILTIPVGRIRDLASELFDQASVDAIFVDTGNYYPARDGVIEEIEMGMVESQWVASIIGRPVVKAFNSIGADSLARGGRTTHDASRIALPIAGDDERVKARVGVLVDAMDFDWVDAGSLAESWRQQPGSPVYCTDLVADKVEAGLARAVRASLPQRRDDAMRRKQLMPQNLSAAAWLTIKREIYGA